MKPDRSLVAVLSAPLFALLNACTTYDVKVVNTPLAVDAAEVVEPFAFSDRLQVATNNPYDDMQAVIQVPEGKIVIVEYVSATVFGDIQDTEEFTLTVSGSAPSVQGVSRPSHFVAKLQRINRTARGGQVHLHHEGGGLVRTYAIPSRPPGFYSSINISVTSNLAVGDVMSTPRNMFADVQLSGRLVNARQQ